MSVVIDAYSALCPGEGYFLCVLSQLLAFPCRPNPSVFDCDGFDWDNISFWHLTLAFTFSKTIPPQLGLNLGFVANYMHSDSPESRKLIFPILTPGPTV